MEHLTELIDGYRRFRASEWANERARWTELAEGQNPKVMVIACSDSRVDPAQIFDVRPGEMFVVRNVAALAPPYETSRGFHGVSAALEFAVTQLGVGEILVMGHGLCGGCAAALTGQFQDTTPGDGHFIADWVRLLDAARDAIQGNVRRFERDTFTASRSIARNAWSPRSGWRRRTESRASASMRTQSAMKWPSPGVVSSNWPVSAAAQPPQNPWPITTTSST